MQEAYSDSHTLDRILVQLDIIWCHLSMIRYINNSVSISKIRDKFYQIKAAEVVKKARKELDEILGKDFAEFNPLDLAESSPLELERFESYLAL